MTEFEVKLRVPADRYRQVLAALGDEAHRIRLRARYFDDMQGSLGKARVEVRLRKEGARWLQTAKAASTALERGRVSTGDAHAGICELELELKSGRPHDAVRLARRWLSRHGLWLSTLSKSARGRRLAGGETESRAVPARTVELPDHAHAPQVVAAMVRSCLDQILPNASEIAEGQTGSELVHQLRVGLRRLRTVLREARVLDERIDPTWEPALAVVFRTLGQHRDGHYLAAVLAPQLEAAGGPKLPEGAPPPPDIVAAVRSGEFQGVLLDMLAWMHESAPAETGDASAAAAGQAGGSSRAATAGMVRALLRKRLRKLFRHVRRDGERFATLDEPAQHRVRKRLKRLRYLSELAAPLFGGKRVQRFLDRLKPVQDALGVYNDELMALRRLRELSLADPRALFGVGWLAARRVPAAEACARQLRTLENVEGFWRK